MKTHSETIHLSVLADYRKRYSKGVGYTLVRRFALLCPYQLSGLSSLPLQIVYLVVHSIMEGIREDLRRKANSLRDSDWDILLGPRYLNDKIIDFYFAYLSFSYNNDDILLVPPTISFWLANCKENQQSLEKFVQHLNLPSRKLVLFPVNDNHDYGASDGGSHWSLLVYDRRKNAFLHLDSVYTSSNITRIQTGNAGGLNRFDAELLYLTVERLMGTAIEPAFFYESEEEDRSWCNAFKRWCNAFKRWLAAAAPPAKPSFRDCSSITPQQTNSYDCGLYVLAMAEEICCWYTSERVGESSNWEHVIKRVVAYVETQMRYHILEIIKNLQIMS